MTEFGPRPGTKQVDPSGAGTPLEEESSIQIIDAKSICIMGRGACPSECALNETGRKVFSKIPIGADLREISSELRSRVISGDTSDKSITIVDVATVMDSCIKENPRAQEKIE